MKNFLFIVGFFLTASLSFGQALLLHQADKNNLQKVSQGQNDILTRATGPIWTFGSLGGDLGGRGFFLEDMNGDDRMDVIMSSGRYDWALLLNTGVAFETTRIAGSPVQDFQREVKSLGSFTALYGSPTMGVLYDSSVIEMYDMTCANPVDAIDLQKRFPFLTDMAVFDIDRDNQLELIVANGGGIYILNSQPPYVMEQEILPPIDGTFLIGQVDADPEFELVAKDIGTTYVFGADGTIEWQIEETWSSQIQLEDLDQDGMDEIVIANTHIRVFDADSQMLKWENLSVSFGGSDTLALGDVNGDLIPEVIYGQNQHGSVHCYDAGGNLMWNFPNPRSGISSTFLLDMDQDGTNELLFAPDGAEILLVDTLTQALRWQSNPAAGSFAPVDLGDLDQDGQVEILSASTLSRQDSGDGVIHVFDEATRNLKWMNGDLPNIFDGIVTAIQMSDLDENGEMEFVLAVNNLIQVYHGQSYELIRQIAIPDQTIFALLAEDVDADKTLELVIATYDGKDVRLWVFNAVTGAKEWESLPLGGNRFVDLKLANIDLDDPLELILAKGDAVMVMDGLSKQQENSAALFAASLSIADLDQDQKPEVIVGTLDGKVAAFDGMSFDMALEQQVLETFADITVLAVDDFHGDGDLEWLIGTQNRIFLYQDPANQAIWESYVDTFWLGLNNQHAIADKDQDGFKEILIGSVQGLMEFIPVAPCGATRFRFSLPDWHRPALDILDLMATQACLNPCQ